MIAGEFNRQGELIFKIGLIAAGEQIVSVKAILDTGFNDWLLVNSREAEKLGWYQKRAVRKAQTAGGKRFLKVYEGIVLFDGEEWIIPVLAGDEIEDILLGVRWLRLKRLVADFQAKVLTLGSGEEAIASSSTATNRTSGFRESRAR